MSIEAVLTVVTVVLAVMALIPRERAQDLKVRLGKSTWLPVGAASLLVIYWTLLEEVHSIPFIDKAPRAIGWPGRWGPASLALVMLLGAAAWAYRNYRRPLPIGRLPQLASAVGDALARRKYGECMHLLEAHLSTIARGYQGRYWRERMRRKFAPSPGETLARALEAVAAGDKSQTPAAEELETKEDADSDIVSGQLQLARFAAPSSRFRKLVAWAEAPKEVAQDLLRQISLTPALAREIAEINPYLGLRLLMLESTWIYREFATDYARALLDDPQSVIYKELRHSENIDLHNVPVLEQREQPLLSTLAADGVRSGGPRLLYMFLDAGIDPVRSERAVEFREMLNGPLDDFYERGRWSAPPFATIYLLEIIVPRLAVNPEAPVLNLYVVRMLIVQLLRQMKPHSNVEMHWEWPTPTHYLIYAGVSALRDMVVILKERPDAVASGGPKGTLTLPHHAINVLGSVMYECLRSDKLESRFKGYLLDVWWNIYSDKYQGDWAESQRILEALARGGELGGDMKHKAGLSAALSHIDVLVQHSPAADAVRQRFGL